ncbi:MAG: prephenate dehydratase, partial [Planctomycetales bacterium]|nr:prephenate dehydratase [Planctomycetales bacterium]
LRQGESDAILPGDRLRLMAKKKTTSATSETAQPPAGKGKIVKQMAVIDGELLSLLNRRAEFAQQSDSNLAAVQIDLATENSGPLSERAVQNIFREIASGCRELEKSLRVAYLGPEYTYSHLAAIHRFGQSAELVAVGTIAAVFEQVESGHAEFGIVPIENSTDGRISDTLVRLAKSPSKICGEVPLRIHHYLLGRCKLNGVRKVYSKPQALSQCRNWLAKHLPQATLHELASTTEAAVRAGKEEGAAAVASRQAAANYELDVLAAEIEDDPHNRTRFAVIGREPAAATGDDKTPILIEVDHRPGALADVLNVFKRKSLNMTWIESFPIPGAPGRYLFFVELQGHQSDLRVRRAISLLENKTQRLEILGSYPRAEPVGA